MIDAVVIAEEHRGRRQEDFGRGPGARPRWLFPAAPTPGRANEFEFHEDVVINEIMYHPRAVLASAGEFEDRIIVPIEVEWRFDQAGEDLGTAWRAADFDDSGWPSGKALFFNERSTLSAEKNTPLELGVLIIPRHGNNLNNSYPKTHLVIQNAENS